MLRTVGSSAILPPGPGLFPSLLFYYLLWLVRRTVTIAFVRWRTDLDGTLRLCAERCWQHSSLIWFFYHTRVGYLFSTELLPPPPDYRFGYTRALFRLRALQCSC